MAALPIKDAQQAIFWLSERMPHAPAPPTLTASNATLVGGPAEFSRLPQQATKPLSSRMPHAKTEPALIEVNAVAGVLSRWLGLPTRFAAGFSPQHTGWPSLARRAHVCESPAATWVYVGSS